MTKISNIAKESPCPPSPSPQPLVKDLPAMQLLCTLTYAGQNIKRF